MTQRQKQWLVRIVTGGLAGTAAHMVLGYLMGSFTLIGSSRFAGFMFPDCGFPYALEWLGVLLSFGLWFLFGAAVAVATLPFADGGKSLVVRSLLHFGVTAATMAVWVGLNLGAREILWFLIPLALVYVLIWLGRWIGWYVEVAQLRQKLGLAPGPSLFHWRETLPYLPFALLLCVVLPVVLRLTDAVDVPVLTSLLLPYILLPVGGFSSGLSLGKRQGVCPLYPVVCGLLYLLVVYVLLNNSALFHCAIVFAAALAGNLAGAAWRRRKEGGTCSS